MGFVRYSFVLSISVRPAAGAVNCFRENSYYYGIITFLSLVPWIISFGSENQ